MAKKKELKPETYKWANEMLRIGNIAVREARAENHRLGLPNISLLGGRIIYEMPDGEIIVKENSQKQ